MIKRFSWSYSKLKNYDTCPRKYNEIDLKKNPLFVEPVEPGGPLDWGNRVHQAMKAALEGRAPLPPEMVDYQPWVDRVLAGPGKLFVEQKYAITKDFKATQWFAPNVWFRAIGDAVRIDEIVALILDWKTGKVLNDPIQLMLTAQAIFAHFPAVQKVRSEYVWLQEDCTTHEIFDRNTIHTFWPPIFERVSKLEVATVTENFPPKPSGLCKNHCPVKTCEFYKKGGW